MREPHHLLEIEESRARYELISAGRVAVRQRARIRLLESTIGLVEDLRCAGVSVARTPEDFSPHFQICLPYRGFFVWHVGHDEVMADANQVLFVSGGESFHVSQPLCSGYGELIITPSSDILTEIARTSEARLASHPLFRGRSFRADLGLLHRRAACLHVARRAGWDGLAAEELVIGILRLAFDAEPGGSAPSRSTRRLIGRTKEFLEAHLSNPIRLGDVARAVGASPAYLTDVFRRTEGVPLHRYLLQLRLGRALLELPHASDLTTLAIGLGFSSHSHFSAVFRRAFGQTPSAFRAAMTVRDTTETPIALMSGACSILKSPT